MLPPPLPSALLDGGDGLVVETGEVLPLLEPEDFEDLDDDDDDNEEPETVLLLLPPTAPVSPPNPCELGGGVTGGKRYAGSEFLTPGVHSSVEPKQIPLQNLSSTTAKLHVSGSSGLLFGKRAWKEVFAISKPGSPFWSIMRR